MLLKNKTAIIYGGAGAIGSAVAIAFAKEGCNVLLAGRTLSTLEKVVKKIREDGGTGEAAIVDAMKKEEVETHLAAAIAEYGRIDISFNAISFGGEVQGTPLTKMPVSDFSTVVITAMHTHFITATAAARYMRKEKSGVILAITANVARKPYENSGGFGVTCAAIEGFCRQLAIEEGKHGIRVVCMRSAGSPDAPGVDEAFHLHAEAAGISREKFESAFAERTMLKRLPKLAEVANTAVLISSDKASAITAAVINVTCGEIAD